MTDQERLSAHDPIVDVTVDIGGLRLALHQIANGLAGIHQALQLLTEESTNASVGTETLTLVKTSLERCLATTDRVQQHLHAPGEYRLECD